MTFTKNTSYTIRVKIVEIEKCQRIIEINEFYWKIKEQKMIVVTIVHKNVIIWFVQVLLINLKYPLADVYNKVDLMKPPTTSLMKIYSSNRLKESHKTGIEASE